MVNSKTIWKTAKSDCSKKRERPSLVLAKTSKEKRPFRLKETMTILLVVFFEEIVSWLESSVLKVV